jgi:hypothetical protein
MAVVGLAAGGVVAVTFLNTAVGVVILVVAAVTWWGLATADALRSVEGTAAGRLPDSTVTPQQGARIEHAEHLPAGFDLGGGGGDSGG